MPVTIGSQLGSYEITALLGKGGMGEVYRARDLKLKREVAIKILPEEFSRDAERASRFQREAEVLAALNHPNIASIYDLASSGTSQFLVLELVDGDTLADRIARGPIPLDDALNIAKQVAEALDAAHEKGIIHRDLKPANIKVTIDGKVKVLDFGLAKIRDAAAGAPSNLSQSPTLMTAASGMILGTAAYMSPEQAKGRDVGRASDVWSFGCVLYEMLTARLVFDGETVGEVLAGIFKSEPDWNRLPAETPADIRRLLLRCLQKDATRRLKDAGTLKIEIEEALSAPSTGLNSSVVIAHPHKNRERVSWMLTAIALVAAAGFAIAYWRPVPRDTAVVRFTIPPPKKVFLSGTLVPEIAISPDGKYVAFTAEDGGLKLWIRAIDAVESKLMPGTDGASSPFWSPDGKFIGFSAGGKLKKISLDGGTPQSICDLPRNARFANASWNRQGVIAFSFAFAIASGLYRVSSAGGQPSLLTSLNDKETTHFSPFFLPDGRHFLYLIRGSLDVTGVYVGSLDSKDRKRILDVNMRAIYSAGHLLFVRDEKLMAQPFDAARLETRGDPFLVADAVGANGPYASMSASDAGLIAYGGASAGGIQLAWFDRTGHRLGTVGQPDRYTELRLSPDGKRVALVRYDPKISTNDLWLAELSSGIFSRFTSDPGNESDPVWSPDGRQIAFHSNRKGSPDIYLKTLGGSEETVLFEAPGPQYTDDWTKDGRFIIFRDSQSTGSSEYALPMFGEDRKPVLLLKDPFVKDEFNVSPDGRWIAYNSGESEKTQVYVAAFPSMTERRQVSNDGGGIPKWRRDGKELYYLSADGKLMAVDVKSTGTTIETGAPKMLFQTPINVNLAVDQYDVTADSQKFLLLQPAEQTTAPPITVVINWLAGLNKK